MKLYSKHAACVLVAAALFPGTARMQAWQMKRAPLMTAWASMVDTNNPLPEYPRPQMVRSDWMSLNGLWQFQPGAPSDPPPFGQTLSGQILAPYPMESALSGVMQYYEYSWYRRTFTMPAEWSGKRLILHLDAVNWQATVYVNGSQIGVHKGGYDPFSYDITPWLNGGSNELILQVYSPVDNGGQPRGKQTLYPGGIMYTSSSGIWQPVWLEPVDASGVNTLQIVPDADNSIVRLTVNAFATSGVTVSATALSNGVPISSVGGVPRVEMDLPVPNATLWSPENPFLYGLQVTVRHNGAANDSVASYFGMRKISVQNVSGVPQIFLNNQRYFEMGPLDQGFWPDGVYTAPTDAALEYDLQLEKALGFNMVRKHIKVERQRWYYWADKLGVLVWQDMPSCNSYTGNPQPIDPNQFVAELTAMVTNHWNSTAIVDWTLFNEGQGQSGYGQTNTPFLARLVKTLDPSRLVNQASGNDYHGVGDVLDNHSYPDPGDPISPTQATVDGEFGGIAWHVNGHLWNPAQAGTGYLLAASLDNFAALYDGYMNEILNAKSPANGGLNAAVYTQITDVENECNGLMTYDRLVKPSMDKIYMSNLKAITGQVTVAPVVPTSQTTPQTWQYTTSAPAANWYASNFDASSWNTGLGGFGTVDPNVTPNTTWNSAGYIYLRRAFNPGALTPGQINNLGFTVYHDENVVIYINGVFAASASGYSTTYVILPMSAQARAAIVPNGANVMAVSCYQTSGGQFIDAGISDQQLAVNSNGPPQSPPAILLGPVSQTIPLGGLASFSAQAVGGALSYQWNFGGTPISGATNTTFMLTNAAPGAAGTYSIVVSNAAGLATNSATLTVRQFPVTLLHRYSFVSNANDSVGGANGALAGPNGGGAASISNGLILPGNVHGGFGYSGYVTLPAGLLTATTNLTVECWLTQNQANIWAEAWDFGNNGSQNFALIPFPANNNNNMEVAFTPNGGEVDLQSGVSFPNGARQYVCVTYESSSMTGCIYVNGVLAASQVLPNSAYTPGAIGGANGTAVNSLGNDVYGDDQFSGAIHELRIWNGVVSPLYLAASAAADPGVVATNLAPTSLAVTVANPTMTFGTVQPASALANFVGASGVDVTRFVTNWMSSNPSILMVDASGAVSAVGTGSATISATMNGVTRGSGAITVPPSKPVITREPPAFEALLGGATLAASVGNFGTPPFVYRWYFNGGAAPISTETAPALTISNLLTNDAGSYFCVISNQYGTATSSVLSLTVVAPTTYQRSLLSLHPVAYWPLSETTGTVAHDLIGGEDGTFFGGGALGQSGPAAPMFGGSSRSALFDGSSAYVDVPGGPFNITGAITSVVWAKVLSVPNFAGVFGHGNESWRMSVNNFGQPGASIGSALDATAAFSVADGNWHCFAYTYSGAPGTGNGLLYVDGELAAIQDVAAAPSGDDLDVWIGGSPDYGAVRLINAQIAHAALFTQALMPAQLDDLYSGIYPAPVNVSAALSGMKITLTWPAGMLLQSGNALGPWTSNTLAASPYTISVGAGNQFFKVLVNP